MIELANVSAKGIEPGKPPSPLRNVSLSWGRGVLAVLGGPIDGGATLLGVLAGTIRTSSGRARVHDVAPGLFRPRVFHVPMEPLLPEELRVEEVCALAADLRGEPRRPATERLALLGVEALAPRKVKSLSSGEARGVALALALSSKADVVLVEEPFAAIDPVATSRVAEALRARAAEGASVIMTTTSVRDASRIADHVVVLTRGVLTPMPPPLAYVAHAGGGASVRVVVPERAGAASLVAALTADASVTEVQTASYAAASTGAIAIHARGPDLLALGAAVTRAIASLGVAVEAIETDVLSLEAIRASLAATPGGAR